MELVKITLVLFSEWRNMKSKYTRSDTLKNRCFPECFGLIGKAHSLTYTIKFLSISSR
jgi:hypothetical protein